jgi:hypothetical protein
LVIPKTIVQDVIKENHDRIYAAHPGIRRTRYLIALKYWWPGMRKSIEDSKSVTPAIEGRRTESLWPHSEKWRKRQTLSRSHQWTSQVRTL